MAAQLVPWVSWLGSSYYLYTIGSIEKGCGYIRSRHHITVMGNLGFDQFCVAMKRANLLLERQSDCPSIILGVMRYLRGGAVCEQSLLTALPS